MANVYEGANWKNRLTDKYPSASDNARYYDLVNTGGQTVISGVKMNLLNAVQEGNEGTQVMASNMNRILAAQGITSGTGGAFALEQEGFALFDGAAVRIKLHEPIVSNATLNINGTGDIPIVDPFGNGIRPGANSNAYLTLVYNGAYFVSQNADASFAITESASELQTIPVLSDNTIYSYGTVTSLTVSAYPAGEYLASIRFTAGSGIVVSLPSGTKWNGGSPPSWAEGKTYELSVLNGNICYAEF